MQGRTRDAPRARRGHPPSGCVFAKGAWLGHFELLAPAVYVLAVVTVLTTVQRILYVRTQLREAP